MYPHIMQTHTGMSATSLQHLRHPEPEQPHLRRTRTRDTVSSSGRKLSPNRVKSRPANQAVIAGIIHSLDAFDPTPTLSSNTHHSRSSSRIGNSTPRSASGASSPSITRSSFMPESTGYGTVANDGAQWDISEEEDDAAPPPVVAVSPISSRSHQSSRASRHSIHSEARYTPSLHSLQQSPVAGKREPLYPANRNLSAESWIKQNIQQSLESAQARTTPSKADRERSSRAEGAERQHLASFAVRDAPRPRKASGEVYRKPPPASAPSSKSRIFIDPESPDEKVSGPPTPRSLSIRTKSSESYRDAIRQASAASLAMSPLSSSRASPIADSIPLRTSSLRQDSSCPAPMRKKKLKTVKKQIVTSNPFVSKRTETISDTSFLDLGEDDETVRRIMELRKKRETRLMESGSASDSAADMPPIPDITAAASSRPAINRSFTDPARPADAPSRIVETVMLYDL